MGNDMDAENTPEVHKLHWWFFAIKLIPWIILMVVFIIIGQVVALWPILSDFYSQYYYIGAFIILGLMTVGFVIGYLQWIYTTLTLGEGYLVFSQGIISRRVAKIPLQEIASIDLQQSIFQRFLKTGDLVVDMRGASLLRMYGLDDPASIQNRVMEMRRPGRI